MALSQSGQPPDRWTQPIGGRAAPAGRDYVHETIRCGDDRRGRRGAFGVQQRPVDECGNNGNAERTVQRDDERLDLHIGQCLYLYLSVVLMRRRHSNHHRGRWGYGRIHHHAADGKLVRGPA